MNKQCFFAVILASLALSSCTTIPPRPLDSNEQQLVGIWMINESVKGIGRCRGVQQMLPDRRSNFLANTVQGMHRQSSQWEAMGDRIHESSMLGGDQWSPYRLSDGGNTLTIDDPVKGQLTWKRYSHNPFHRLEDAFQAVPDHGWSFRPGVPWWADLSVGALKADLAIHKARAAVGNQESIEWIRENKPKIEQIESNFDQSAQQAQEAERNRFPID